jgi:PEP-CTERM motif
MKSITALRVLLPMLVLTASSDAAIVLDSITGTTPSGIMSFKGPMGILPYQEFGMLLHVDNASDFTLDSITLDFASAVNTATSMEASLWTAGTGTPQGTFITDLTGATNPSSVIATYTPTSPVTLTADSEVFVLFKVTTGTGFYRINGTTDPWAVEDWSFTDSFLRGSSGGWNSIGSTPRLQVNATPVPEPATAVLLGGAALALGLRRRRAGAVPA